MNEERERIYRQILELIVDILADLCAKPDHINVFVRDKLDELGVLFRSLRERPGMKEKEER